MQGFETDWQTDMSKLIVAFRNFANAPKNNEKYNPIQLNDRLRRIRYAKFRTPPNFMLHVHFLSSYYINLRYQMTEEYTFISWWWPQRWRRYLWKYLSAEVASFSVPISIEKCGCITPNNMVGNTCILWKKKCCISETSSRNSAPIDLYFDGMKRFETVYVNSSIYKRQITTYVISIISKFENRSRTVICNIKFPIYIIFAFQSCFIMFSKKMYAK